MANFDSDITTSEPADRPPPRWLIVVGAALLIALMAVAAFSLGVFVAERGLF